MPLRVSRSARSLSRAPDSYFELSRTRTYGLLLALPLLTAYEVSVALINAGERLHLRNAADIWLRGLLRAAGFESTLALSALLVAAVTLLILRERRTRPVPIRGRYLGFMLVESAGLAAVFGTLVGGLTSAVLGPLAAMPAGSWLVAHPLSTSALDLRPSAVERLVLSLGAGLYEELVFRVLLIPALVALLVATRRVERRTAIATAVVTASVLFSAAHYIGPLGDSLALGSFTFRFIGGLAFSLILVLRGFGIVAWTHALYDVFLIVGQG